MLQFINSDRVDPGNSVPTPTNIINTITDFGVSKRVIDSVEMAFLELFNSEQFVNSSSQFRSDILLDYKLTMDTLRGIAEVERIQYSRN